MGSFNFFSFFFLLHSGLFSPLLILLLHSFFFFTRWWQRWQRPTILELRFQLCLYAFWAWSCGFYRVIFLWCLFFFIIYIKEFVVVLKMLVVWVDLLWWTGLIFYVICTVVDRKQWRWVGFLRIAIGGYRLLEVVEAENDKRKVSMFQTLWKRRKKKKNERDGGETCYRFDLYSMWALPLCQNFELSTPKIWNQTKIR